MTMLISSFSLENGCLTIISRRLAQEWCKLPGCGYMSSSLLFLKTMSVNKSPMSVAQLMSCYFLHADANCPIGRFRSYTYSSSESAQAISHAAFASKLSREMYLRKALLRQPPACSTNPSEHPDSIRSTAAPRRKACQPHAGMPNCWHLACNSFK